MAEDYYAILGVAKGASSDEIKKAFRKKAHELHPDKGGDANAFKKLNEAYQTVSDPQKRQQYDTFGTADPQQRPTRSEGGFEGFGFGGGLGDIFSDMFSSAMANVQAEVQIGIPQAVLGDSLELRVGQEKIILTVPPGTSDGQSFLFRGKGQSYGRGRGDLTLIVRVIIPRRISRKERELYEQLKKL